MNRDFQIHFEDNFESDTDGLLDKIKLVRTQNRLKLSVSKYNYSLVTMSIKQKYLLEIKGRI